MLLTQMTDLSCCYTSGEASGQAGHAQHDQRFPKLEKFLNTKI